MEISESAVCSRLGYRDRSPSASTLPIIKSQITKSHTLIKPAYTYSLKALEGITGEQAFVEGSLVFTSRTVSHVLIGCKQIVVFLVTIGGGLDDEMSRLMEKGNILEATILDAIGTEAVVQTSYRLQEVVKEMARASGYQATVRYSPGYCDWDVSQQQVLFQAIDSVALGVSLTESSLMIPIKSISGILGIGVFNTNIKPPCLVVCDKRESCSHKRPTWNPEKQLLL